VVVREKTLTERKELSMQHSSFSIEIVRPEGGQDILSGLVNLLQDTVARGASIGFLPPLNEEDAQNYWNMVLQEVAQDTCVLFVARIANRVIASVQLALATKPNARHRAEVQKLMVLQSQRRQGIARALMQTIEQGARERERTLLVLDTRQGDTAEQLYRKLGYQEVGVIPAYAQNASGVLDSTIFFYKILSAM
jgi:acetyltransferase